MDWKTRIYQAYVSTGQARIGEGGAVEFYKVAGPFLREVIRRHMPQERGARIVDLGCGLGALVYWLRQAGYTNVEGYDFSGEVVQAARAAGNEHVHQGDLGSVLAALPEASVDAFAVFDVLEHLPAQELFDACDAMHRALKPGGLVLAHVPNAGAVFSGVVRYGDLTHERAFAESSARQLFRATGFEDVRCFEDTPVAHGPASAVRLVLWTLMSLWHRLLFAAEAGVTRTILTQNMLVEARKPKPAP